MNLSLINALHNPFSYREVEVPLISKKGVTVKVHSLLMKDELEYISSLSLYAHRKEERFMKMLFNKIDAESRKNLWGSNFDNFLKSITEPDINALTMGIIIATHEEEYDFEWICPHCSSRNRSVINPVNVAKTTYPDCEDLINCTSTVFDVSQDTKMKIKCSYPSYQRLINVIRYVEENYEKDPAETKFAVAGYLKGFVYPIEEVTFYDQNGGELSSLRTDIYSDFETLITIFNGLTNRVKKKILERTKNIIDKEYGTILEFKTQCSNPECRRETDHKVEPFQLFLSMIAE